ncbi:MULTISPECIES: hypothetical protein [unclassified Ochrobactrum]|uniref:hypothetical protein n=1 Tax=unclassified Ochrobactrum TaxID=239106 RepID=UPI0013B42A68|nr:MULTISPECIES: hypothetical protein [unclassified Ochrobactrum]MBQ0708732.1 hypothetical protein [Ochrobactrum sp. AP1BH01-1]
MTEIYQLTCPVQKERTNKSFNFAHGDGTGSVKLRPINSAHATNSQKFQKLLKIERMTVHCRQFFRAAGCGYIDGSAMHREKIGC